MLCLLCKNKIKTKKQRLFSHNGSLTKEKDVLKISSVRSKQFCNNWVIPKWSLLLTRTDIRAALQNESKDLEELLECQSHL